MFTGFEIVEVSNDVLDDNSVGEYSSLEDGVFDDYSKLVTMKVEMIVMNKGL
jgi:hypothetical protein